MRPARRLTTTIRAAAAEAEAADSGSRASGPMSKARRVRSREWCRGRKRLELVGRWRLRLRRPGLDPVVCVGHVRREFPDQRHWPGETVPSSAGLIGCSAQASGGGGAGLVQVEAPAPTPLNFNLQPAPSPTTGAVYSNPPFAYAGGLVTGEGRSGLRYAGAPAPDYTGAVEVFSLGNAPSTAVTIHYQGALEAPNSTPQNPIFDPATIKSMATGGGPITAANLDELDGYAFIEFIVDFAYAAPPTTPPSAILPSVDSITINFSAPSCP